MSRKCPVCGYGERPPRRGRENQHTARARTGDFFVCLNCGEASAWNDDGGARPLTELERERIPETAIVIIRHVKERGRFYDPQNRKRQRAARMGEQGAA